MEDKELKNLLSTTKLKADDHLKDRIIHQIKAEQVLIPKKSKPSKSVGNHFSIFGIMYALLLFLVGYFYIETDGKLLESTSFFIYTLFIASSFSIYWLINVYVEYRKLKS